MPESYYLTVCSLGENANLPECLRQLLLVQEKSSCNVEVLLVLNTNKYNGFLDPRVKVCFEPERGYSNVRNKAISAVPVDANIIFIDDDEIPSFEWFEAMRKAHEDHPGDVIFGPVYPLHKGEIDSYRKRASEKYKFLSDGELAVQAPTANLLIPFSLLNRKIIYFDPIFNKSGSEDTDLCFRLRNLGVRIRYSQSAILLENEKPQRFDSNYLQSRQQKDIANYSLVIRRNSSFGNILWRFSTLLFRIFLYGVLTMWHKRYRKNLETYFSSMVVLLIGKPKV